MPTINQLQQIRCLRKKKKQNKLLQKCPQKRGVCTKLLIMSPRKPNSAKRKVAKIRLSTRKYTYGYIRGEGHNLQKFAHIMIQGGLIPDLPGVHYRIIRGKLDLQSILKRRQGRSKYGTAIWWKPKKKDISLTMAKHKLEMKEKGLKKYVRVF
jgi:small subunit ribosomal protein S12